MGYRVDNVPWHWRPLWLVWSWLVAVLWGASLVLLHATCRIRVHGREHLSPGGNIYAFWHRYLGVWFVASLHSQRGHAWLQHPAAYMKPVHLVLSWMGVRRLLGSGGEEGRQAAAKLAELVREGASTSITPDGPRGPAHELKKGVLHIALGSGAPIIPVRMQVRGAMVLATWDRKLFPLPFSRIDVTYGAPIYVTQEDFEEAGRRVAEGMTGQDG